MKYGQLAFSAFLAVTCLLVCRPNLSASSAVEVQSPLILIANVTYRVRLGRLVADAHGTGSGSAARR